MVDKTLEELVKENDFLRETLNKIYGIDRPFICGGGKEVGADGLADMIMVCPSLGADGFAIYKKHRDYSAPAYQEI